MMDICSDFEMHDRLMSNSMQVLKARVSRHKVALNAFLGPSFAVQDLTSDLASVLDSREAFAIKIAPRMQDHSI